MAWVWKRERQVVLGPRFHPREPVLGILRGVLSSHLLAWASFKTKYFQCFFFLFKIWGYTSLLGNIVALFISHTLYGVFLAEQYILLSVPMHQFHGRLISM